MRNHKVLVAVISPRTKLLMDNVIQNENTFIEICKYCYIVWKLTVYCICSGLTYEIYSCSCPSAYLYCVVCYCVIATPCGRSFFLKKCWLCLCTPLQLWMIQNISRLWATFTTQIYFLILPESWWYELLCVIYGSLMANVSTLFIPFKTSQLYKLNDTMLTGQSKISLCLISISQPIWTSCLPLGKYFYQRYIAISCSVCLAVYPSCQTNAARYFHVHPASSGISVPIDGQDHISILTYIFKVKIHWSTMLMLYL